MEGLSKQRRGLIETPRAQLDALVYTNLGRGGAAAVLLHPYALLGGSMQDHMVAELFRAAAASRAFSLVVRYNQRGVGRSSGSMNVRGREDMLDVLDVVEWAAEQLPGPDKQVAVIGYSWGACLAAHALTHPAVAAYVGVSFPLGGLSWVLQTKRHFGDVCRASHVPRLLILGDQDQFTKEAALQQAVRENGGALLRQDDSFQPQSDAVQAAGGTTAGTGGTAAAAAGTRPFSGGRGGRDSSPARSGLPGMQRRQLLLRIFQDSDHFWISYSSLAAEYAVGWLETLLTAPGLGADCSGKPLTQDASHAEQAAAGCPAEEAAAPVQPAAATPAASLEGGQMSSGAAADVAAAGDPAISLSPRTCTTGHRLADPTPSL